MSAVMVRMWVAGKIVRSPCLRSDDRLAHIQGTKLITDNVNINKRGLHAINGPYPQVGLQCRNKQTNNVHIWYQSRLSVIDSLM